MQVQLSPDKTQVLFIPSETKEYLTLNKFPGFIRAGLGYTAPAFAPFAFNLVARLQAKGLKVKVSKEVQTLFDTAFTLKTLPEDFNYWTPPLTFQDIALRYLYTLGSAGILLDPGMGKTKVILDYIYLMKFFKALVVCPKPLMFVWEDEIPKHRPELGVYLVKTTDWSIEGPAIGATSGVIVMNYTKAALLKTQLSTVGFNFIYLDEFLIKNAETQRTQAMLQLAQNIPYRSGGSGTLINNTPLDAFYPIKYLQPCLVGGNFKHFQNEYTHKVELKGQFYPNGKPKELIVGFKKQKEVKSILESCCIVMTKDEWLTLPAKHIHDIVVPMSAEQDQAYDLLSRNYYLRLSDGDDIEVDNPLVMLAKLYQIANGFVYINQETPGVVAAELLAQELPKSAKTKQRTFFFDEQPKVEALRNLLTRTIPGLKAIIWFNLSAEFTLISALLDELEVNYLTIRGGEKDVGGKVRTFNRTPSVTYLLCQAKSVNYGITVMGTKSKDLETENIEALPDIETCVYTEVFYSLSFSLEVLLQQMDRIHRIGQEHECDYYRIITDCPVEEKIVNALGKKLQLKEEMLVDFAKTVLEATP